MPYVSGAVLIKGQLLSDKKMTVEDVYMDAIMAFSANLREKVDFFFLFASVLQFKQLSYLFSAPSQPETL